MHREYRKWWSPRLGREMELLVYGHAGTPLLAFPSSMGRFHEWEDFGMVGAIADKLEHGHNRLVCIDSVDKEALYNRDVHPYVRLQRYKQYQAYVTEEVVPFVHHISGQHFIIAAGCSFGAYHAANLVFKHPWHFGKLIALSGAYEVDSFLDGFHNEDVYFNSPTQYLPNLEDHGLLEAIRRNEIVLTAGEYDPCKDANYRMSHILEQKGIPHHFEMLRWAFGHDWPWWQDLLRRFI